MSFLKMIHREFSRVALLLAIVALLLWADSWLPMFLGRSELSPLITSCALVLGFAAISHLTRRVLFPQLDLQHIARQALQHPIGAGMVFLGVCYVIATLLSSNTALLR